MSREALARKVALEVAPRKQVDSMPAQTVTAQPNTAAVKAKAGPPPLPAITGFGHTRDGRTLYTVASRSKPGRFHMVIQSEGRIACDCEASKFGKMCAHKAVVQAHLQAKQPIVATTDWYRDTAPLYRDNLPFSIFKQ
jgi:hypothetical protein